MNDQYQDNHQLFLFYLQALLVSALVAVAAGAPAGPLVAAPGYAAPDLAEPPVYAYNYGVNDDYSGANFQQSESRDGYTTSGSYSVALPDGRTQTVTYSDNGDGIVQDVTYDGVPQYGPTVVKTAGPIVKAVARPVAVAPVVSRPLAVARPVAVARPIAVARPVAVAPVVSRPLSVARPLAVSRPLVKTVGAPLIG